MTELAKVDRRPQLRQEAPREKATPDQVVAFGNQVVSPGDTRGQTHIFSRGHARRRDIPCIDKALRALGCRSHSIETRSRLDAGSDRPDQSQRESDSLLPSCSLP
jgi:hypothetical protein